MNKNFARRFGVLQGRTVGRALAAFAVVALWVAPRPVAALTITPTFTDAFNSNFGVNAIAAQNAWIAAANVFQTNFSDNIHINITVDAVAGTTVFGQSLTSLNSFSFTRIHDAVVADAKTPDDVTSIGAGGSVPAADPIGGAHAWWVSRAEAKALGLIADDLTRDGTTTFGAGNPFTFSGAIAPGTFDFEGIAAHEISEVLGRRGLMGKTVGTTTNSYELPDLFTFTSSGARNLACPSSDNWFSIDDGSTLLKRKNDYCANGADTEDWAPGTRDSFNQFSSSGVVNAVSLIDLRQMDVLGYDRVLGTPEPGTFVLLAGGLVAFGASGLTRRMKRRT
jgi:hypothetical protein